MKIFYVIPSRTIKERWRTGADLAGAKAGWAYLQKFMRREDRAAFQKWWRERGAQNYAEWLVENNCAFGRKTEKGIKVDWATAPNKGSIAS